MVVHEEKYINRLTDFFVRHGRPLTPSQTNVLIQAFRSWRHNVGHRMMTTPDGMTQVLLFGNPVAANMNADSQLIRIQNDGTVDQFQFRGVKQKKKQWSRATEAQRSEIIDSALCHGKHNAFNGARTQNFSLTSFLSRKNCKAATDLPARPFRSLLGTLGFHSISPREEDLQFQKLLTGIERSIRKDMLDEAIAKLDPAALAIMRQQRLDDSLTYQWLQASSDDGKSKYRRQAALSYPALTEYLGQSPAAALLRDAVDRAAPLQPAFRSAFALDNQRQFPPAAAKWLHRLERLPRPLRPDAPRYISALSKLPAQRYPIGRRAFIDFAACVDCATATQEATGASFDQTLDTLSRDWEKSRPLADLFHAAPDFNFINDYLRAMYGALIFPVVYDLSERDFLHIGKREIDLAASIIRPGAILGQMRLTQRWHGQLDAFNAKLYFISPVPDLRWAPLSPPVTTPNGVHLRCLTSPTELREQGRRLSICVGSYSPSCLKDTHIIALYRREQDAPLKSSSTARLIEHPGEKQGEPKLVIAEHRGPKNLRVETPEIQALNWYQSQLKKNMKPDWQSIFSIRTDCQKSGLLHTDRLQSLLGFNPADNGQCIKAFEVCRPYLPENQRHFNYSQWLEAMNVRQSVQAYLGSEARAPRVMLQPA